MLAASVCAIGICDPATPTSPARGANERTRMIKIETTNKEDVKGLELETERVFDSVRDARAYLNDNYTTGRWVIFWDEFFGAYIYRYCFPHSWHCFFIQKPFM